MIVQAKNNIGHHNTPPLASLSGAEINSGISINGASRQQQQQQSQQQHQQPPPQPPPAPTGGPPHYVDLHVNAGECVSLQLLDGQEQVVAGPATITMISQQQNPPVPIPVQVPPGHMIHQIADENGTLKQIILSVMDANEDGASQLDATVITLPQGTFRIDSNGELVSTSTGERSTSSDGGLNPLTTIPQQAYFANYDGCPPLAPALSGSYTVDATANPTDTIEQPTANNDKLVLVTDSSCQESNATSEEQASTNDSGSAPLAPCNSNKASPAPKGGSNKSSSKQQMTTDETKQEVTSTANQHQRQPQAEQIVTPQPPGSVSDPVPVYSSTLQQQQVMASDIDLIGGGVAPIIPGVDGQLYGYPTCCCCCYCDPSQETAAGVTGDQQPGQQDAGLLALPPTPAVATGRPQAGTCRSLSQSSNGPAIAYPGPMLGGRQPMMQANLGVPLAQPMVGQNGIVPVPGGAHIGDSCNAKPHPANKGGRNGYKQHKMVQVSSGQAAGVERGQPPVYSGSGGYASQINHKSYNSIVSGHHHHSHHSGNSNTNSNHLHQQQHYHQDGVGHLAPPASAATFKNQPLFANHQSSVGGSYSSSVYSNYNNVPGGTMASAASPINKAPLQSGQAQHQHQNQHGGRAAHNGDSNYMQRVSRDQANTYNHIGNNCSASGYMSANSRHNQVSQQHNNENLTNKSRQLGDKTTNQQQQHNSNRYANVKLISNNHVVSSSAAASSPSHRTGSVSPIRARMKNYQHSPNQNHSHNHHHQYNQVVGNNELKDSNTTNNLHSQANYHGREQASFQQNHSKSSNKSHQYPNDGGVPVSKQHISSNAAGGYHSSPNHAPHKQVVGGGAWQPNSGHKFGQFTKTGSASSGSNQPSSNPDTNVPNEHGDGERDASIAPRQSPAVVADQCKPRESSELASCRTTDDGVSSNEAHLSSEKSPGQGSKSGRLPVAAEITSDRHKRSAASSTRAANLKVTTSSSQSDTSRSEAESGSEPASDKGETKPKPAGDAPGTTGRQQHKQPDNQKRAGNKESKTPTSQKAHKQQADNLVQAETSTKPECDELQPGDMVTSDQETAASKKKHSQASVRIDPDLKATTEPLDELGEPNHLQHKHSKHNKHNSNSNQQVSRTSGDQPNQVVRDKRTPPQASSDDNSDIAASDKPQVGPESHANDGAIDSAGDDAAAQIASRSESPASLQSPQVAAKVSMRTSLSENNIRSLESRSSSSSKQKLAATTDSNLKSVSPASNRKKNDATSTAPATKRRGSNPSKSEQKVKLSTIPQLRILNLNCTSVTSGSVQLRWSYVPSLADRYGIHHHHHHHGKSAILDHFVIESSSSKNLEANSLVAPKIVYQGCALTCRINHLSPDRIYHFRVRRTALLTVAASSSESSSSGEHSVVSEILSVTLPSVQQQGNSNNTTGGQQSVAVGGGKKSSGGKHQQRGATSDASSSGQSNTGHGEENHHHLSAQSNAYHHNHNHNHNHNQHRGNTSSHNINSNHNGSYGNNSKQSSPIKLASLLRQCRGRFVATLGKLVQKSLSSCSDTKFAGLLLVVFTIFAMLLAVFIHLYIVAPVTE